MNFVDIGLIIIVALIAIALWVDVLPYMIAVIIVGKGFPPTARPLTWQLLVKLFRKKEKQLTWKDIK